MQVGSGKWKVGGDPVTGGAEFGEHSSGGGLAVAVAVVR